jgi:hypothetical protein
MRRLTAACLAFMILVFVACAALTWTTFGRKLPMLFQHCGLENVHHEATAEVMRGGSPWARWWQETLEAIRGWEQAGAGLRAAQEKEYNVPNGAHERDGTSFTCPSAAVPTAANN